MNPYRDLPRVDRLLAHEAFASCHPALLAEAIRTEIEARRNRIVAAAVRFNGMLMTEIRDSCHHNSRRRDSNPLYDGGYLVSGRPPYSPKKMIPGSRSITSFDHSTVYDLSKMSKYKTADLYRRHPNGCRRSDRYVPRKAVNQDERISSRIG
jgi:hypothetical protein